MISIIIPTYNEEKHIEKCLLSIINNHFFKNELEVLVIDGNSNDNTKKIVMNFCKKYPFIRLLNNPARVQTVAFNIGIREAKGDIIIIMSAHAEYSKDYISKSIYWLEKSKADCVGGIWIVKPGADTLVAKAISLSIAHPFGVGNAYYRIGSKEPRYVDTVPFGCYKKEVFDKVGLFNEELLWSEDDEFNARIIKNGGKILLVPEIFSYYYARESLPKLAKQYFRYGYSKVRAVQKIKKLYNWRQLIPAIFVSSLILTGVLSFFSKFFLWLFSLIVCSYLIANFGFSFTIAIKKGLKFFPVLPVVFAILHFSYGLGYLKGIWDFLIRKKHLKKKIKDIPLTR